MNRIALLLTACLLLTSCTTIYEQAAYLTYKGLPLGWMVPVGEIDNGHHWEGPGAGGRFMNMDSEGMPNSSWDGKRNVLKDVDSRFLMLIGNNQGDGQYAGYSIYVNNDIARGEVDKGKVEGRRKKHWRLKADSIDIGICFFADQSTQWNRIDPKRQIRDLINAFDDQVCCYMIAIEPGDTSGWTPATVADLVAYAKSLTKHPVGVHDYSSRVDYIANSGADFACVQCWHPGDVEHHSPADLENKLNWFRSVLPAGMDLYAFEWASLTEARRAHIREMHKAVERSPARWSGSSTGKE